MTFSEFAHRLFSVMSGGSSAEIFTKTLFSELVTEMGKPIVDEKDISNYKAYYYGTSKITRFARTINMHLDRVGFIEFVDDYGDAVAVNLCSKFSDAYPDATPNNISELLADCFIDIVTNAAKTVKKEAPVNKAEVNTGNYEKAYEFIKKHLDDLISEDKKDINPFANYLEKAKAYFSKKKTLLYAETAHPFYEMYVCNDVVHYSRRSNKKDDKKRISNATISSFEPIYTHAIIEGTGGIGKSMFLTHLFLSFEREKDPDGRTPILIQLRDFKTKKMSLIELILYSVKKYDSSITEDIVVKAVNNGKIILLLDGLDEVQSKCRGKFNEELENYVKSHLNNTVIMTSRPISSFVSYTQFALFDIQELTKVQAVQLIEKLEFWDVASKNKFLEDLNKRLYQTHHQFACNPLLLTIMLMTYSSFGDVPAKMHLFYSEAYRTMSRLHDASKDSYVRPLYTGLTPEEFSEIFAEFCARTYVDECVEFEERVFTEHIKAVLKKAKPPYCDIKPHDFLLDLIENLCIMYSEGEKYYFIHRSFQEYFAALFFSSTYDDKIKKLGPVFENKRIRFNGDIAFDMLFDMIPDRIERYVFLPYLDDLFSNGSKDSKEEYWNLLEKVYPTLCIDKGQTGHAYVLFPSSFLYEKIICLKNIAPKYRSLDDYDWPSQINDWPTATQWCDIFSEFTTSESFEKFSNPDEIPSEYLERFETVKLDDVPGEYYDFFGEPTLTGMSVEIEVDELRENALKFPDLISAVESTRFPLMKDYLRVKKYHEKLKAKISRIADSDSLFDD